MSDKQRTTNNNKNENMKMRKKLITALVLGACVGTQAFAQSTYTREDVITFALTVQGQSSVSTSATVANAGNWSDLPTHYKTATKKLTQTDLLKAIAIVMHGNANYYSSQAKLVLVQGELGGFWNINDALAQSYEDSYSDYSLTGTYNEDGTDTYYYDDTYSGNAAYYEMNGSFPDGYYNYLETYLDTLDNGYGDRTSIADGTDEYARLATGRHFLPVPGALPDGTMVYDTSGQYPPGHMQPWGQIFVKDPGRVGYSVLEPLCENVTFFFYLEVQECYDCFYLNSFISDANFTFKAGTQSGPPCCTSPESLIGKGVDKYYLSLSFDNTVNNSYLNPALERYTDSALEKSAGSAVMTSGYYYYEYVGYTGLRPSAGIADGTTPDLLPYVNSIRSQLGKPSPYEMRFTLNGIVTYSWQLKFVNASDLYADYVGTASYSANGFGFIGLVCQLITGTATFTEKVVKDTGCCDDIAWYENWYGPGSNDEDGYFDPYMDQFNPYPYPNIVGGVAYGTTYGVWDLPDQNESPNNPGAALTYHGVYNPTAYSH
jgi:hypothetical protein